MLFSYAKLNFKNVNLFKQLLSDNLNKVLKELLLFFRYLTASLNNKLFAQLI